MLRIVICDDEKSDGERIRDLVTKALFEEDVYIQMFQHGNELVKYLEKGECDLLLLDIGMEPLNGMEVAEYIRTHKMDLDIIFITKSTDYVYRGYQYRAFAYILKDRAENDIPAEINRYITAISQSDVYMNITISGELHRIPLSSIRYIESDGRKLILHRKNDEVSFYCKMSEVENELSCHDFIRIHQSYMVALREIQSVKKDMVVLEDIELPVSRRYSESVRQTIKK